MWLSRVLDNGLIRADPTCLFTFRQNQNVTRTADRVYIMVSTGYNQARPGKGWCKKQCPLEERS